MDFPASRGALLQKQVSPRPLCFHEVAVPILWVNIDRPKSGISVDVTFVCLAWDECIQALLQISHTHGKSCDLLVPLGVSRSALALGHGAEHWFVCIRQYMDTLCT